MEDTASIFAVAAPGLESVVAAELNALGLPAAAESGGASWQGSLADVARANLELRTASRVLVRAGEFRARTFHELERRARRIDWARFVSSGEAVQLRITCRKSALYHEGAVAERILDALEERTGRRGVTRSHDDDDHDHAPGQLFIVRLFRDLCTVSADSSGDLLHRRGYREALAKAPLRENLAAAMLLACGWSADAPLLDPLCGSGTIPIEAALIARDIAPGIARADRSARPFRFLDWPAADAGAWNTAIERARSRIRPACPAPVFASDRNAGAIRAAGTNAERAGVAGDINFDTRTLSTVLPPAGTGWIVTNPPYGERIGSRADADRLLRDLEQRLTGDFAGWNLAALTPAHVPTGRRPRRAGATASRQTTDPVPAAEVTADRRVAFETRNGGIPVRLRLSGFEQ